MEKEFKNKKITKVLKITKKVAFWICIVISAFLAIVASCLCVDKFILKSKVPSFCGFSTLMVTTGSMSGTIEEDDYIIIRKTNDYKIGDIITFIQNDDDIPTTHRIIAYGENGEYITKGDANDIKDQTAVKENEILGEVVAHLRGLSLFIGWAIDGGGYIYILAIILVVGLGVYFIKESKKENIENQNNE